MRALVGRTVFSAGDRAYVWEDVVLAAGNWGEWGALRRRTEVGLALEEGPEATSPPEADVEAAAEDFRYERGLLSADDLDAWLGQQGLCVDDWLGSARRTILLERSVPPQRVPRREPETLATPLHADSVYAGDLDRLAQRLAEQAAVFVGHPGSAPRGSTLKTPSWLREISAVLDVPLARCADRVAHLVLLERSFRTFTSAFTKAASVARSIEAHRVEWLRFELRTCVVGSSDQASELTLLVREDGLSLERAAAFAGIEVRSEKLFLDDVTASLRDHVLGARPGDLAGPAPTEGGFALAEVLSRTEPSPRDPAVRARARAAALAAAVERETGAHVRWEQPVRLRPEKSAR